MRFGHAAAIGRLAARDLGRDSDGAIKGLFLEKCDFIRGSWSGKLILFIRRIVFELGGGGIANEFWVLIVFQIRLNIITIVGVAQYCEAEAQMETGR